MSNGELVVVMWSLNGFPSEVKQHSLSAEFKWVMG